MVLRKCAEQIEAGNSEEVAKVLNKVQGRPTHGDLNSILHKLDTHEAAKQSAGGDGNKPSN